jgi:hypothetical protein
VFYLDEAGKAHLSATEVIKLRPQTGRGRAQRRSHGGAISADSFRTFPRARIFVWCAMALARPLTRTLARAALKEAVDHGKAPSRQPTLTPAWTKPPVLPARRVFATEPSSHFRVTYIEMRRFLVRPSSELFEATGWSSPKPFAVIRDLSTPIRANSCNT